MIDQRVIAALQGIARSLAPIGQLSAAALDGRISVRSQSVTGSHGPGVTHQIIVTPANRPSHPADD